MEPLVSVIVPVYNVLPYLREALDSVINQTYRKLEILIIDDGSTDGSDKICDEYAEKDQRICVIHQENKGLSSARNAGLNRSFIEKLKSALDREQADLALCKYTDHYTTKKMNRGRYNVLKPRIQAGIYNRIDMFLALSDGMVNVSVWNKLYRRELWKEVRFQDGHVYEDREATFRIINECEKTAVIDAPLYYHRIRPESITATPSWDFLSDRVLAAFRVDNFVSENLAEELPEKNIRRIRQTSLNSAITAYARAYKVKEEFDRHTEREKLRQQIIRNGKKIGIENCIIKTRAAYHMIHFCPWLFGISYPIYRPIRMLVYKLTGR